MFAWYIIGFAVGIFTGWVIDTLAPGIERLVCGQSWIDEGRASFSVQVRMMVSEKSRMSVEVLDVANKLTQQPKHYQFCHTGEYVFTMYFKELPFQIVFRDMSLVENASIEVHEVTMIIHEKYASGDFDFERPLIDTPTELKPVLKVIVPYTKDGRYHIHGADQLWRDSRAEVEAEAEEAQQPEEHEPETERHPPNPEGPELEAEPVAEQTPGDY